MSNWKPVVGFEGYEVSDDGRVRSIERTVVGNDGVPRVFQGRDMITQYNRRSGRPYLILRKSGRSYTRFVHRLVVEAHIRPIPPKMEVCHNDGDILNNHVSNLRIDTRANNQADKVRHGTNGKKLTCDDVIAIRARLAAGDRVKNIAEEFNVTPVTIYHINTGRTWRNL